MLCAKTTSSMSRTIKTIIHRKGEKASYLPPTVYRVPPLSSNGNMLVDKEPIYFGILTRQTSPRLYNIPRFSATKTKNALVFKQSRDREKFSAREPKVFPESFD